MDSTKCEKCGGDLGPRASACPACGAPLNLASERSGPRRKSSATGILLALIIALAAFAGGAWLFTAWSNSDKENVPAATPPESPEPINLDDLKARAERGEADAQTKLGRVYAKGQAVRQDYKEAANWYRQAAEKGNAEAQTHLGELYEAGRGVPRDEAEAAKWYRRAAEQGDAAAQYDLAVLYVLGKGVPQDNAEALKWYRQAADQGDSLAQFNLGMRYYEGKGVSPDPVEAYQWLSLAAAQGLKDAVKARDELKRRMTRSQISEARRRTEAFVAKKPAAHGQ